MMAPVQPTAAIDIIVSNDVLDDPVLLKTTTEDVRHDIATSLNFPREYVHVENLRRADRRRVQADVSTSTAATFDVTWFLITVRKRWGIFRNK